MKRLTTLLWLGFFYPAWSLAADGSNLEELLEEVYLYCPEEVPYETLEEHLWECYHDPLDLNQASREELKAMGILTEEQLDHFFDHLANLGALTSIYELQTIPTFGLATIHRLVPFVKVVDVSSYQQAFWPQGLGIRNSYGLMRYERVIETQQGYLPNRGGQVPYLGSPGGRLARVNIKSPGGWGVGLSTSVKAGELFTWNPEINYYGGALHRFHWIIRRPDKILQSLVVGDYAVGYGEGLALHSGFAINKSGETIKVIRTNNLGIRPHTSLTRAAFRGVAMTWQWKPLELTVYKSMVKLDGKLRYERDREPYVKTISRGGTYRTKNELAKKAQVPEQVVGSTIVYKSASKDAVGGINVLYTHYGIPIKPTMQGNPMRFQGQHHANTTFFYRYLWQNLHFFSEGGLSADSDGFQADSSYIAGIAGVVASFSRYVDATVLGRYYGQAFHAPYGYAFRENSVSNSNERGLYLGLSVRPWKKFDVAAYYDYFYFPWFKGETRDGRSWLAKATYQPRKASLLSFQYKGKIKPRKIPRKPQIEDGIKYNYKLRYKHNWSKTVSLNTEVQWSNYEMLSKITRGYAAVQDIIYKVHQIQLKCRVAWFSTDDHLNKLAFYEPNVLYSGFNFPAYQGRGMRYGLLVCYKPTPAFRLEMKYTLTHYRDRGQIGSAGETIMGNVKNEVRLQAVFRF